MSLAPGEMSKGVRKLREKEAAEGMQIVLESKVDADEEADFGSDMSNKEAYRLDSLPSVRPLNQIQDVLYRGALLRVQVSSRTASESHLSPHVLNSNDARASSVAPSMSSRRSVGVMDWSRPSRGSSQWERTLW